MRRLMRRLIRAERDERGAVVVLVAMVSVVLVVMAALVVDVGSILDERRQLQNAADASALAVAQTCVGQPSCAPTPARTSLAGDLANRNSKDNLSNVDSVTFNAVAQTVTVNTSTRTSGGTILPYWFGRTATGEDGKTIHATATASYGGLGRAKVIPLTLSLCEFNRATTNGTVFDLPATILFHTQSSTCKVSGSGADVPGGYGWIKDNNDSNADDCSITPSVGNTVPDDTGVPGTPHSCDLSTLVDQDVLVPVYDSASFTGSNGEYHIYGFGMFHLTGYRFSTQNRTTPQPCNAPSTCIAGRWIRFVATGDPGGPNLGNRVFLVS
jgi:Flp pilus assembly protein TadG